MRLTARTLDDLLRKLYARLLASRNRLEASRGANREILGVLLELTDPLARLSRSETRGKPYSCLGELLWYLSRDNRLDFIQNYIVRYKEESEDGETVYGGYGPRLFNRDGINQVQNVTNLLAEKPTSRRAVIQLFDAQDIDARHTEVPCTCTLQFVIRSKRLHLAATMRSNDAYKGLPHDVFCFTMLQEIVARTLGVGLGRYRHFATSMHLYEADVEDATRYLSEGVQATVSMPRMPTGNPWPAISNLLDAESRLRSNKRLRNANWQTAPYWADLIRLLAIYAATGNEARIEQLKGELVHDQYRLFADARKGRRQRNPVLPNQGTLDFDGE